MKTIKLIIAFCTLQLAFYSQPYYTGITTYNFGSVTPELSDGLATQINSNGFAMIGYIPVVTGGVYNVYINKVDQDGAFNGTPSEFTIKYRLHSGGNSCGITLTQELNCYGSTLKETFVMANASPLIPSNLWYVSATAFGSGCAFTGLDANGTIVTSGFYTFPSGATSPSKPLISESIVYPGQFYIAGSFQDGTIRRMYVLCSDAAGTIIWTKLYDLGPSTSIEPRAIIESPYSGNPELAIVGMSEYGSTLKEGFFALLDYSTNGGVNQFTTYGDGTNATNDFFTSIAVANSPAPTSIGYVIGGYTEQNSLNGKAWVTKIDQSGTVIWSSRLKPTQQPLDGEIVSIIERFSVLYGGYEYYAATISGKGSLILKLDNNGSFFTQVGNLNNEIYFQSATGGSPLTIEVPKAMSFLNTGSVNDGIHVYGTSNNTGTGDFILTQAYFNGAGGGAGCYPGYIYGYSMNSSNIFSGPSTVNNPSYNTNPGISSCSNYQIFQNNSVVTPLLACPYEYVNNASGIQSKSSGKTGISNSHVNKSEIMVKPNPISSSSELNIQVEIYGNFKVHIYNSLGKKIQQIEGFKSEKELKLNLSSMKLNSGIYHLILENDRSSYNTKFIIE